MNHDDEVVDTERFNISQEMEDVTLESMQPAEQEVAKRLTTPIVNTYLDTKDIAFERQESYLLLLSFSSQLALILLFYEPRRVDVSYHLHPSFMRLLCKQ